MTLSFKIINHICFEIAALFTSIYYSHNKLLYFQSRIPLFVELILKIINSICNYNLPAEIQSPPLRVAG